MADAGSLLPGLGGGKLGGGLAFSPEPAPADPPKASILERLEAAARGKPSAPPPDKAGAQALWLQAETDRQRRLSPQTMALQHRRDLPGQQFLDEFYAQHRPVVLEGVAADWPAIDLWTPEYLARKVGGAPVEFQGGRNSDGDFELLKDNHRQAMPFDAFIERICAEGAGNDAYITAYNNGTNAAAFAPLQADLGTLDEYLAPGPGMLWIGPVGTFTPLHFDLTNNLLVQIAGLKEVTLIPPSQTHLMYNHRHVFSEVHDIDSEERLAAFPLAQQATPVAVILEPGDALFVPFGWWHQVRSLEFSAMLTYTGFLWPNDPWKTFPQAPAS